jgi:hypothetical protein
MEAGPRENDDPAGSAPGYPGGRDPLADMVEPLAFADGGPAPTRPEPEPEPYEPESYAELRPARRLRLSQLAPIVALSLLGSLMFAFPLAFAFDEAGAVVAMLGLLIGCSAAGWGMLAARRVGYTWPGLPPRGSGRRADWRLLLLYGGGLLLLAALALWRVAGLR